MSVQDLRWIDTRYGIFLIKIDNTLHDKKTNYNFCFFNVDLVSNSIPVSEITASIRSRYYLDKESYTFVL